ncbi:MAG: hypothetical protein IRY84_07775, partial [Thermobispora bispora]|nr:hypothetical protein [Thermobispora bispora]
MGVVTAELARAATAAGAVVRTGAEVIHIDAAETAEVTYLAGGAEHVVRARHVLANVAPATLDRLRGRTPSQTPEGAQVKLNLLLTRLPRLRSGADPRQAYDEAAAGWLPERIPFELYCHTLTDPAILPPDLADQGWHTMTAFALQTPARLFRDDNAGVRELTARRCLAALDEYFAEPIEECLARDADGRPCHRGHVGPDEAGQAADRLDDARSCPSAWTSSRLSFAGVEEVEDTIAVLASVVPEISQCGALVASTIHSGTATVRTL